MANTFCDPDARDRLGSFLHNVRGEPLALDKQSSWRTRMTVTTTGLLSYQLKTSQQPFDVFHDG